MPEASLALVPDLVQKAMHHTLPYGRAQVFPVQVPANATKVDVFGEDYDMPFDDTADAQPDMEVRFMKSGIHERGSTDGLGIH